MSVPNFMAICPIVVRRYLRLDQSGGPTDTQTLQSLSHG